VLSDRVRAGPKPELDAVLAVTERNVWRSTSRPTGLATAASYLSSTTVVVPVLVGDVFDEQHEQDIVLVLAGIHAAAQFITVGP
jgi:hypothetical protein